MKFKYSELSTYGDSKVANCKYRQVAARLSSKIGENAILANLN